MNQPADIRYRRARFSTRLPRDRRYTLSHFWVREEKPGTWQVGLTRFATRMLGEFVEMGFDVEGGAAVAVGDAIGWVEGFKALTDLYCVVEGEFLGGNPALEEDITLADSDPYGAGWIYRARGAPDPAAVDAHGYVAVLDTTIDRLLAKTGPGEGA